MKRSALLKSIRDGAAVLGLVVVIGQSGSLIYQLFSFNDVAAFAVPICEEYAFGPTDDISPYFSKDYRLLGISIYATNPVRNARIRFSKVFTVREWGIHSDGLSDAEIESFLSELPTGPLPSEFITPPLPDLPANTKTAVMMIGRQPVEDCGAFVDVTTTEAAILQGSIYYDASGASIMAKSWFIFINQGMLRIISYVLPLAVAIAVFLWRLGLASRRERVQQ